MSTSLYLSDIIKRAGLDINRVKLIRHVLSDKDFRICFDSGFVKEYTQIQRDNFAQGFDYWIIFISGPGTSARLEGCYKVNGVSKNDASHIPPGFPLADWFDGEKSFYDLQRSEMLEDLVDRLIIDWGKSTRSWQQKATIEKPVIAIQANPKYAFNGYENIILTYNELNEIIADPILYENWHVALSSVYAIYLIVDTQSGRQYIGSSYGTGGLLNRWSCYVHSKHGNNKGMMQTICEYPDRYKYFQFSILQILPKNITQDEVNSVENLYKNKLLSKKFGMNKN